MIFLINEDFKTQINEDNLEVIINNDYSILYDAERKSIQEMESYLSLRFDTENIFNRTGEERSALLVMYLIDMMLYHIHSRINPRKIPDLRGIRYEAALAWLSSVAKGLLSPKLPTTNNIIEGTYTITEISTKKRRNRV